jgi:spermidine synthase
VLHRLLQHEEVEHVTIVEIDLDVMRTAARYFDFADALRQELEVSGSGARSSGRIRVEVDDAVQWVGNAAAKPTEERPGPFDLVVIDSTDFSVGSEWSPDTYAQIKMLMRKGDGGHSIMLANLDTPFLSSGHVTPAVQLLVPLFSHVEPYLVNQPEFATGSYAFMFASDGIDPLDPNAVDWGSWEEKKKKKHLETFYYNRAVHSAAFALPQFFRDAGKNKAIALHRHVT